MNTFAPDFELSLGGQPLDSDLRASITSVRFEEALEGASRVELQFANPDLRHLDRPDLDIEAPLELSLGYRPGTLTPMFAGWVTGLEPAFSSGAASTLTVSAQDATSRLSQGKKSRAFPHQMTDSAIAALIASENGLVPFVDPIAGATGALGVFAQKPRYQNDSSDYQLLRQLAAEYGFDVWVDGQILNVRLTVRELMPAEIELRWGDSLLDFSPRETNVGQVAAVNASIWVEQLKTTVSVGVAWNGERLAVSVQPSLFGEQNSVVEATLTIPDLPSDTPIEAIKWVLSEMRRRLNTRLTASGSTIGDPRFRVGKVIAVSGVGSRFSGRNYRLTSVAHTLDTGGYRTRFQARKEVI